MCKLLPVLKMLTPNPYFSLSATDTSQEEPGREQENFPEGNKHKRNLYTTSKGMIHQVTGKTDA